MRISCFSIKPVKVFVSLLLVCVSLGFMLVATGAQSVFLGYQARRVPIYSVDTAEKKVALTFDAAWGADKTSKIVEILSSEGIEGTFFLVGFWSEKYADKIKEIDAAGFDIGTHSNTHPKMSQLSREQVESELVTSMNLITNVTGKEVKFFRPPYGDYNDQLIDVATGLNLKTIQWSVDSLDWKGISADEIQRRVLRSVEPGSIVLFHNAAENTPEALPGIIEGLIADGYTIVPISQILLTGNTTIDHTGKQCPA